MNGASSADSGRETDHRPPAPTDEFDTFYREMYPELLRYGMALTGDGQDAHDAAAEVFIEIYKRWHQIDTPRAYAKTAFKRSLLKVLRRKHKACPMPNEELPNPPDAGLDFRAVDEQMWVDHLLALLPAKQREVMRHLVAGHSYAQMIASRRDAEAARQNAAAVRKNAQLARKRLRDILADRAQSYGQPSWMSRE
ncbi:hypothetical protein Q0Z83_011980 [Actinoplanes sichuanensis]|uniref:RNA polymerase sigma factor n=1 Tax=Actinoplanes sichuanensis TaxID=512349 RepID=A0ABW4A6B4_9ACTN|nr:sigma-70 family RNA polymerase sigma factor [Actinoplanes sichuanensis]BEL03007.1 hypothetical protein Q0Z83_011980 [Actinoplanes sichuanensis]